MTRTACVWCPDWPVVAARRREPALREVPVFVRERVGARELVRAASPEARTAGVRRGMRRTVHASGIIGDGGTRIRVRVYGGDVSIVRPERVVASR